MGYVRLTPVRAAAPTFTPETRSDLDSGMRHRHRGAFIAGFTSEPLQQLFGSKVNDCSRRRSHPFVDHLD